MLIVFLALDFRRISGFDLGPGALGDILIVGHSFLAAEAFHLLAHRFDQFDHHFLQGFGTLALIGLLKCFEKILLVRSQFW